MKLFLILCVVLGGVWLWRMNRRAALQQAPTPASAKAMAASAQEMVHCDFCSLHIPRTEAVQGQKGLYCSPEHQRLAES